MGVNDEINIFIAYSRKDENYLIELKKYVIPLERRKSINFWYDGEIKPGEVWEEEIKKQLHKADIVILLVSANSIASEYFYEKEVADALERHNNNETIVIPIILKNCAWNLTPLFDLQALPKNGKPISNWKDDSDAYTYIVHKLNERIETILDKRLEVKDKQKQKEKAEAKRKAEEKRKQKQEEEAEVRRQVEEKRKQKEEAESKRQTEEKRKQEEEAETKRQTEEKQKQKEEAEVKSSIEQKQYEVSWRRVEKSFWLYKEGNLISGIGKTASAWFDNDLLVFHKESKITYVLENYKNLADNKLRPAKILGQHEVYWRGHDNLYWLYKQGNLISSGGKTTSTWSGNDLIVYHKASKTKYVLKNYRNLQDNALRPAKIYNETTRNKEVFGIKKKRYRTSIIIAAIIGVIIGVIWISKGIRDDFAWKDATRFNTIYGYKVYQKNYPRGSHFYEAQRRITKIESEKNDWDRLSLLNTKEAYEEYLKNHPYGANAYNAKKQIEEIQKNDWERALALNTADAYNDYLKNYPRGSWVSVAKEKLKAQVEKEADGNQELKKKIKALPVKKKVKITGNKTVSEQYEVSWKKSGNKYWLYKRGVLITGDGTSTWSDNDLLAYDKNSKMTYLLEDYKNLKENELRPAKILGDNEVYYRGTKDIYWLYKQGSLINGDGKTTSSWSVNDELVYHKNSKMTYLLENAANLLDNKLRPAKILGKHEVYWRGNKDTYWLYIQGSLISGKGITTSVWSGNDALVYNKNSKMTYLLENCKIRKGNKLRSAEILGNHEVYWRGDKNVYWLYKQGSLINGGSGKTTNSWFDKNLVVYHKNSKITYLFKNYTNSKDNMLRPAKILGQNEVYWRNDKGQYCLYKQGNIISGVGKTKTTWSGSDLHVLHQASGITYILENYKNLADNTLRPTKRL